ncbi:MAG: peptidase [Frankiales bacterium]|nr:peptidase [Frankiales bacterium]
MGPVAKLTLRPKSGGGAALALPYNPETLEVSASADYTDITTEEGVPGKQYMGRSSRTTTVEARLDARALTRTVPDVVQQVFGWLGATPGSQSKGAPTPPLLALSWGKQWFDACLTAATASYTMFAADGTPTRAVLSLSLTEVELPVGRQNPTSGSLVGSRSHQVVGGDSLHSVATAEYGDPQRWRDLALANDIDDPMALRPGTRLLLPSVSELSAAEEVVSPWS